MLQLKYEVVKRDRSAGQTGTWGEKVVLRTPWRTPAELCARLFDYFHPRPYVFYYAKERSS